MQPILTIHNPFPDIPVLKVYSSIGQADDLVYPIELGHDIFIMKWNYEDKWHCNGIYDQEVIADIGRLIQEQEPGRFL